MATTQQLQEAKKINQFLGKDYTVMASVGHVRDLPPKKLELMPHLLL